MTAPRSPRDPARFEWESPVWRHLLEDLGSFTTLVRYDERGSGLSDWQIADHSLDARVNDLESVVDQLGFGRVALLGMSHGATARRSGQTADRVVAVEPEWRIPTDPQSDPESPVPGERPHDQPAEISHTPASA